MTESNSKNLSISEAAQYLGVNIMTLRRWDEDDTFKPSFRSPGGHRYYSIADLDKKTKGVFRIAQEWVSLPDPTKPETDFYCQTSDVFKARFERMVHSFIGDSDDGIVSLITSSAGEIGNNSFDHNLGNWPDLMGIFFAYDPGKRRIVLADRGVGILSTLRRVLPELSNDEEALQVAFTKYITGRAPEHRGNGLKYVVDAIEKAQANLLFQSGNAVLEITKTGINIKKSETFIRGCLTLIEF